MFAIIPPSADRSHRVRFKRPVRVVPLLSGPPRAFRVLAGNLSRQGMFLQMPEPFPEGTQLALSLEAGGRVLPFAQCEVIWRRPGEVPVGTGFGVRFTGFLHPRAHELVQYLVDNLDRGVPLPAPKLHRFGKLGMVIAFVAAMVLGGVGTGIAVMKWRSPPAPTVAVAADEQLSDDVVALPLPEVEPAIAEAVAPEPVAPAPVAVAPVAVAPVAVAPVAVAPVVPAPVAPAPSPQPEAIAVEAPPVAGPAPKRDIATATGSLPMPKSAVSAIRWVEKADTLSLDLAMSAGGAWNTVFMLRSPSRLVIDLNGPVPAKSFVVSAGDLPHVKTIRLGRLKIGTRLVIDFEKSPTSFEQTGSRVLLHF